MTLGQEFRTFVAELLEQDGSFGSTMRWRHITRVEDAATGVVTPTNTESPFRGGVVDPVRTRLFSAATMQEARTAVAALPSLPFVPSTLDQVELTPGRWMTVIEIKEIYGPGDGGAPVLIAYLAALGAT